MENKKKSLFAILSLLLILLISFNGASIFSITIPENVTGDSRNLVSVSSSLSNLMFSVEEENPSLISKTHFTSHENTVVGDGSGAGKSKNFKYVQHLMHDIQHQKQHVFMGKKENPSLISNTHFKLHENTVAGAGNSNNFRNVQHLMHDVQQNQNHVSMMKKETPSVISNTHLPLLRKSHSLPLKSEDFPVKNKALTFLESFDRHRRGEFRAKVKEFFSKNETCCKVRFFMTWISSLDSFSEKEFNSIETLFNTHPNGCLLIVSNSMDSIKGRKILNPFLEKGFRVTAISPDLNYLFKNTMAESWYVKLIKGDIHVGYVPLGQNLSNLLRYCLLYKFGGVYIDTDVIVLKSFSKLKNSIGAQTLDLNSKNWSRLNNAVMVFDKMHPLVYKFIEEFALTFDGNKWGHNGPYLVSRVVSRLQDRPGYNFTILPPMSFYPVNWNRVRNLFRGAKNETDAKWLRGKLRQIRNQSYAVHLWNKQSRTLHIEQGSIVGKILSKHCVFCNRQIAL